MKRNTIFLQFIQNGIIILKKKNLSEHNLKSVVNYKVIDRNIFVEEINIIIDDLKINNNLLTDNINIIVDNTYSELDKETIKCIFKELSFNKITFLNITKLLTIQNNEILIDISTNNIKIYFMNELYEQRVYFSNYNQILTTILRNIMKNNEIKIIKIFGNSCNNRKVIMQLEKYMNLNVYIYSHSNLIPIKLLS